QTQIDRREHRRDRGIAAKTDNASRGQPTQQTARLQRPDRQLAERVSRVRRSAPELGGADMMRLDLGDPSVKAFGPRIADEMDLRARAEKPAAQRFGRDQMAAGTAGS